MIRSFGRVVLFCSAILALDGAGVSLVKSTPARAAFLDDFPKLGSLLYSEPETRFFFGFGVSPITIIGNRVGYSFSIFQLHWINVPLNWEVFNSSYGSTIGTEKPESTVRTFTFRTAPKLRVFDFLSVGPVVGYEFVSFPDILARTTNMTYYTPEEPFSSQGLIYGATLSESFKIGKKYVLRANQIFYKQTYSATKSPNRDWGYYYSARELNADTSLVDSNSVFMIEISFLY